MALDTHINIDPFSPGIRDGQFARIECRSDTLIVVDGVALDISSLGAYDFATPNQNIITYRLLNSDARLAFYRVDATTTRLNIIGYAGEGGSASSASRTLQTSDYPVFLVWPSGETQTAQQILATFTSTPPQFDLEDMKNAARRVHNGLVQLSEHLERLRVLGFYDPDDVFKAERYITYLHRGTRAVVSQAETTNNRLAGTSVAARTNFCFQTLLATSDIMIDITQTQEQRLDSIARQYFTLVEEARLRTDLTEIGNPAHAIVVYDIRNSKHVPLKDVIALSGSGTYRHSGETSDVNGLELDTLDLRGDIDGSWIDSVRA